MDLLIVGPASTGSLENWYRVAFERAGVRVFHFDVMRNRLFHYGPGFARRVAIRLAAPVDRLNVRRALLSHLYAHRYDVVLVFKGVDFSRDFLERCRAVSYGAMWVNYNPDDPFNIDCRGATNEAVIDAIPFYDLYLTWSHRIEPLLQSAGAKRVAYLPFGYDREAHCPYPEASEQTPPIVSFVGAWDREREAILAPLADLNLQIHGDGWHRIVHGSPLTRCVMPGNIFGARLAQVIGESAVSFNIMRRQNAGSHNMRTFEIPAMGGVMLTTRSDEQQEFFPEGEAALMYADIRELRARTMAALADAEHRLSLRAEALRRAVPHSYDSRVLQFMDIVR